MIGKLRLLPALIVVAALMLGVKLGDLWRGVERAIPSLSVAEAQAQEARAEVESTPAEAMPVLVPPAAALTGSTARGSDAELFGGESGNEESALRKRLREKIEALVEEELEAALARHRPPPDMQALFTQAEVEVLHSLTKRREALDARASQLDLRENLLSAAEGRIDEKIAELEKLEATIQAQLKQYDEEEEAKMRSLVKIYENMKPKDAARIFQQLDMEILLEVAERMREAKMAPILAQIDPGKAKAITVELATRRQLPAVGG